MEGIKMEIHWPGTKIVKSQNNAFTSWKTPRESVMANDDSLRKSKAATNGRVVRSEIPNHLKLYKEKQ